jgi:two-component system cell cycle sensor histidine kinase PleC
MALPVAAELQQSEGDSIAAVALPVVPVTPETLCKDVYQRFRADPDLIAIPVVADGRPIGLVNRYELTMSLAQDYGRALYASKPITARMDAEALIVESNVAMDALEWMIAATRPSALTRGFIVTREGRYLGVGTALSLLQLSIIRSSERTRQVEEARSAAETANSAKSRFLAVMSHELRTPLNAIIGFSDAIRSEIFGPLVPSKYREYLHDIHYSAHGLLDLINDILDVAKIESGKMELFEESVDLDEAARAALRMISEGAHANRVELRGNIAPGLPQLFADRRAIKQILQNLLSNAVKFTPGGSVMLTVREDPVGGLAISVRDTGIGMSAADIQVALAPFGQVANALTRVHAGTGLGLPLVKSLAELHGAAFSIDSASGLGTTVEIVFPPSRVIRPQRSASVA